MPNLEPVVLEGRNYTLRHIGPQAVLLPNPPIAIPTFVVLNQPAMIGRPLPMTNNPNSPDMVSGNWIGRLLDAGEFTLTFPNKEASDGQAWRNRFAVDDKNQWIEIRNDGYLESVCCIEKVDLKRDQIVISGHDGLFQLKNAYERDWIIVQSPRDILERASQLWVVVISDDFSYDSNTYAPTVPKSWWTTTTSGSGVTASISTYGNLILYTPATLSGGGTYAEIINTTDIPTTSVWSATLSVLNYNVVGTSNFVFNIIESSGDEYNLLFYQDYILFNGPSGVIQITVPIQPSYGIFIESDGEWVTGYVNGQLVGGFRRGHATTTSIETEMRLDNSPGQGPQTVVIDNVYIKSLQSFLMRGADKGDYALPSISGYAVGTISTYPPGGLHARYYNDADLATDDTRVYKIHHYSRSIAYNSSGASEYANQLDEIIDLQNNPLPGAATSNWSVLWFGAIWLELNTTNYSFQINLPDIADNFGVRLWVGMTTFGSQIIDEWVETGGGFSNISGAEYSYNLVSSTLAGTLSYGEGTILRNGWYPIKIEYAVDSTASTAPTFLFTPSTSYTDPGGTSIIGGEQIVVPYTSLSPLGCVDNRHQGISHYDLYTKNLQAFGYQASLEPQSLESGLFPGVLAPRFREGTDYDTILEPDDYARTDGLLNYENILDATDICTSLQGNGAGFQNGNTGQLQGIIFDHTHLQAALYDIQGWQDFSDAAFAPLLQASLNSLLGLKLDPWQVISGDPIGRVRLANQWPLPSALAQMRWRPGDGMRIYARDVNIQDLTPRQLLMITRQIHPNGSTGTSVGFAERPRSGPYTLKQAIFQATRWARNYQKSPAIINGNVQQTTIIKGNLDGGGSTVLIGSSASIVSVYLYIGNNTANENLYVYINGINVTTTLGSSGWSVFPVNIDISRVALINNNLQIKAQLYNAGTEPTTVLYQIIANVLV